MSSRLRSSARLSVHHATTTCTKNSVWCFAGSCDGWFDVWLLSTLPSITLLWKVYSNQTLWIAICAQDWKLFNVSCAGKRSVRYYCLCEQEEKRKWREEGEWIERREMEERRMEQAVGAGINIFLPEGVFVSLFLFCGCLDFVAFCSVWCFGSALHSGIARTQRTTSKVDNFMPSTLFRSVLSVLVFLSFFLSFLPSFLLYVLSICGSIGMVNATKEIATHQVCYEEVFLCAVMLSLFSSFSVRSFFLFFLFFPSTYCCSSGMVNAAKKLESGQLYAIKCVSKKHALYSGSLKNILLERDVLAECHSRFVVELHYALQDKKLLYFVLDLMRGGDLGESEEAKGEQPSRVRARKGRTKRGQRPEESLCFRFGLSWKPYIVSFFLSFLLSFSLEFHLRSDPQRRFPEDRARFYAAEILLGLEHIHSRGIIYRGTRARWLWWFSGSAAGRG